MSKVFKFYQDAGHGWLTVKIGLLEKLEIANNISSCSYTNGKTVYLEEDRDLALFKNAYEKVYGPFETKVTDHGNKSWVRNMSHYVANEDIEDIPVVDEDLMRTIEGIDVEVPKSDF